MRAIYKVVLVALLAFMFRSPIIRLHNTARQLVDVVPETIKHSRSHISNSSTPRPNGLIAKEGLELLTFGTPNGHKANIILEELKAAYGKDYVYQSINIGQNIQKEPWFTKFGPNGRIPVLVDHDKGNLGIMEGAAILFYLTRNYDPEHKFWFPSDPQLSLVEQWVSWQHGGIGPMQGQANHFYRLAKERIPYPTQRYLGETERLYGVLDHALSGKKYLVGDKYTIADIANFSWVNVAYFAGVDLSEFPNLHRWWKRVNDRSAVKKGVAIPSQSKLVNDQYQQRMKDEPDFKQQEEHLAELGKKAKQQYDYKYSSP